MTMDLDFRYDEGFRCVTVSSLLFWLEYENSFDKKYTGKTHEGAILARDRLIQDLKKLEEIKS